jgi:hypothetical protein
MSSATRITSLMTALTANQIKALAPAEQQLLTDQCERIRRLIEASKTEAALEGAREALRTRRSSGVLPDLARFPREG